MNEQTTLEIQLELPIESESIVSAAALTFSHWLPLDDADVLTLREGNFTVRLYFRVESVWWASRPTAEEIPRHVNVLAHRLWADVSA